MLPSWWDSPIISRRCETGDTIAPVPFFLFFPEPTTLLQMVLLNCNSFANSACLWWPWWIAGDQFLKQYVISEPEATCTERTHEDEWLIFASDGPWNVPLKLYCRRSCYKMALWLLTSSFERYYRRYSVGAVAVHSMKLALGWGSGH